MYLSKQEMLVEQAWAARFAIITEDSKWDKIEQDKIEQDKIEQIAQYIGDLFYGYAKPTPWLRKRAKSALNAARRMKDAQYGGIS